MKQINLKVNKRETGRKASKDYRRDDKVIGVFYMSGEESIPIITDSLSIRPIIYTEDTRIINLEIEGETNVRECVLKEVKFDPVTDKITHFDLIGLSKNSMMNFELPIILTGTAVGVREGGVLQQNMHKLKVKCLPSDLPEHLTIDISHLEVGMSVYVKELKLENVLIEASGETPIVSCSHSRIAKSDVVAATEPTAQAATEKPAEK